MKIAPFAILCVISAVILYDLADCLIHPSKYPIEDLNDKIPVSDASEFISSENKTYLEKIVDFKDIPMNTKFTYEIQLSSLSEVNIKSRAEMYITEENVILTIRDTPSIDSVAYQDMSEIEVSLDGIKQILTVAEIGDEKFYVIPSYNLTRKNEIRTLQFDFRYNYPPEPNPLVKIPILFNDKYVQAVGAPSCKIGVEKNTTSDKCELRVQFDIPFRRILEEQSGWSDYFVSKDILSPDQSGFFDAFQYPIEQKIEKVNDNTYSFSTYFSEENNASGVILTLVPDWEIPTLIVLLLLSPLFVCLLGFLTKDNKQEKSSNENANSKIQKLKDLSPILKAYSIPLAIGVYFGISAIVFLPMLWYLTEIMNPIVLIFVIFYPALVSIAYYVWKK